jgi:hypothetical protein
MIESFFAVEDWSAGYCDVAKGQIDAKKAGKGVGSGGDRGDSMEDESSRASPDEDVAMLDADASRRVGATQGAEQEGRGKAQ